LCALTLFKRLLRIHKLFLLFFFLLGLLLRLGTILTPLIVFLLLGRVLLVECNQLVIL
jgi:hypothetical protein